MAFTFPTDTNNKAGAVRGNPSGTGFHVPSVIYGSDGVTPVRSGSLKDGANGLSIKGEVDITGKTPIIIRETITLEAGASNLFYYKSVPAIIDFLEWSTNGDLCRIEIAHHGFLDKPFGLTKLDGSRIDGYDPVNIGNRGSGIFDIVEHDISKNRYKYKMSRPMEFPHGVRIRVVNGNTTSRNIALTLSGREF